MPPARAPEAGAKSRAVLVALGSFAAWTVWYLAHHMAGAAVAAGFVALMVLASRLHDIRLARRARDRAGEDIGTLARAFDRRAPNFDPWVIRAVWDALAPWTALRGGRPVPAAPGRRHCGPRVRGRGPRGRRQRPRLLLVLHPHERLSATMRCASHRKGFMRPDDLPPPIPGRRGERAASHQQRAVERRSPTAGRPSSAVRHPIGPARRNGGPHLLRLMCPSNVPVPELVAVAKSIAPIE